jgi:hypothetical protein
LWDAYRQAHYRTTKIIANKPLVVEIRAEQVEASEDAKNDRFLTSANFCANGNNETDAVHTMMKFVCKPVVPQGSELYSLSPFSFK